jgi:SAM-dependent methyltransferase
MLSDERPSAPSPDKLRIKREQEFHDMRHTADSDPRVVTRPFYRIIEESHLFYSDLIYKDCAGSRVLEYGCGPGSEGFELAKRRASVDGIDISPAAVNLAASKAHAEGLESLKFSVMDAETTSFGDETFDLVVGSGILHHLNLERAFAEIARILKPEGRAVFLEPLGHNPLINWYRRRTPELRTADEHPLLTSDLQGSKAFFRGQSVRYFHLSTLGAIAFAKTPIFDPLRRTLGSFDRLFFDVMPQSRKYAWMCVLELTR